MPSRLVTEPVYQQLNGLLRGMIVRGEFAPGEKFMAEREICKRFDVSRATANKAVSNLVAEGILVFRKGVGTFVRDGLLDYDLARLVSFTDKARVAGMTPSTKVLTLDTVTAAKATKEVRAQLGTADDEALYWIERLRLADGRPMILERRYLIAKYCPKLTKKDLSQSLYRLWQEKYQLDIVGANQIIRAVRIGTAESELLDVPRGSPGLLVEGIGMLRGDVPIWSEETLYRGDRYEFHNRLGPISSASPAVGKFVNRSNEE